jgi:hypothetical protein
MHERTADARLLMPGFPFGVERFDPHDPFAARLPKIVTAHYITPANELETHKFWMFGSHVPFPRGIEGVLESIRRSSSMIKMPSQTSQATVTRPPAKPADDRQPVPPGG